MSAVYQYNAFNLSVSDSNLLALLSVVFFAVVGALASPLSGVLYDWVGVLRYMIFFIALMVVTSAVVWLPYLAAQVLAAILMYVWYSSWLTLESKTPSVFAPASLYGSYLGTCNTITSLLQLGLSFAIPKWTVFHDGQWEFLLPLLSICGSAIFFALLFATFLKMTPHPGTSREM